MKAKITNYLSVFSIYMLANLAHSQEICLVTADFVNGEKYIVFWEQPVDISNIDSVVVYRKQGVELVFSRIGAVKVGPTLPTKFTDVNANTIDTTKYAIAFKDNLNVEGPMSSWHQPVVYDYSGQGNGIWVWSPYTKENQVDESYITEYRCMIDQSGGGTAFSLLGTIANNTTTWTDVNWASNVNAIYVMETELPTCTYIEKANINTSRSNIKQQFTNAEAGISESKLKSVNFEFLSNPVGNELNISFEDELKNATIWVSTSNGKQILSSKLSGKNYIMNVSSLSQGLYFVNVKVNGVVTTKRFIKN